MPQHKYVKPKTKLTEIYRGSELYLNIQTALEQVLKRKNLDLTPSDISLFLYHLTLEAKGNPVLILETDALCSDGASGKYDKKVFLINHKTGTQYERDYLICHNPNTDKQQVNRTSYGQAIQGWRELPETEKNEYRKRTTGLPLSGYNLFMKEKLKQ